MGHFYNKNGEPCYQIERSDGQGLRDTTLRDARKLNLYKSVTTVMQMLRSLPIEIWKIQQLEKAFKDFPFDIGEDDVEIYFKQMVKVSENISEQTRQTGHEIHASLENYYKYGVFLGHVKICQAVVDFIKFEFGNIVWIPEKTFVYSTFGGCVDLHFNSDNRKIVLDFKTKYKNDVKKWLLYDEHKMQLAAYRNGLLMPDAECYDLFISNDTPKLLKLCRVDEKDLQKSWKMFQLLNDFYDLSNNYFPEKIKC